MFSKFKDLLWPLGATILAMFVVPIAIVQYPEIFKDSPWILPLSIVAACLCWVIPLLVHQRVKRLHGWILRNLGTRLGWIVVVTVSLCLVGSVATLGYKSYGKHKQHLQSRLELMKPPPASVLLQPQSQPNPRRAPESPETGMARPPSVLKRPPTSDVNPKAELSNKPP